MSTTAQAQSVPCASPWIRYEDHRCADGRGRVTLLDPGGDEFCIERGEADR